MMVGKKSYKRPFTSNQGCTSAVHRDPIGKKIQSFFGKIKFIVETSTLLRQILIKKNVSEINFHILFNHVKLSPSKERQKEDTE